MFTYLSPRIKLNKIQWIMADGSSITKGMFNSFVSHLTLSSDFIFSIIVIMFMFACSWTTSFPSRCASLATPNQLGHFFFSSSAVACVIRYPRMDHIGRNLRNRIMYYYYYVLHLACHFTPPSDTHYASIQHVNDTTINFTASRPSLSLNSTHWTRYTIKYNSNEWRISFPIISRRLSEMTTDI